MNALPFVAQFTAYALLSLSLILMVWRMFRGPNIFDRLMTVDSVALILICMMAIWNVVHSTGYFFDVILVLAIVGFVSTLAIAKYMETGDVVE